MNGLKWHPPRMELQSLEAQKPQVVTILPTSLLSGSSAPYPRTAFSGTASSTLGSGLCLQSNAIFPEQCLDCENKNTIHQKFPKWWISHGQNEATKQQTQNNVTAVNGQWKG